MNFSIVTVCLNPGSYLLKAMASVQDQTHADIEYLLVDGGSTDGSTEISRHAAALDPRIVWTSGPDAGIADAMNRGLAMARGEIVGFLHADDLYAKPTVLDLVERAFRCNSSVHWVTGGVDEIDATGRVIRTIPARRFSHRRLLRNNIILHPATFVRREALKQVGGFDVGLRYAMDYDLWLRLSVAFGPPLQIDEVLTCFRVHPGSLSSSHEGEALAETYRIRRRYLGGPLSRATHALYYWWQRFNEYRRRQF